MTAVDLDALDAARAAAVALVAEDRAGGWQESTPDELVDALFAGPLTDLIADARKLRALREAVEGLAEEWEASSPTGLGALAGTARLLRAVLAAAVTSEGGESNV